MIQANFKASCGPILVKPHSRAVEVTIHTFTCTNIKPQKPLKVLDIQDSPIVLSHIHGYILHMHHQSHPFVIDFMA